ncbi:hypothetical protein [Siminovitchia terrae]|uniref:hypothetical protein n=1 Tax=Siminovitchia terrae TaxID=1914933 RepID=UPI00163C42C0|nr:hypothetical protein [Siminovitchia terrae]
MDYVNFIQQKSPTFVSGEMNAYCYSIQLGFKPQLNKIWAQIRQGAFDCRKN